MAEQWLDNLNARRLSGSTGRRRRSSGQTEEQFSALLDAQNEKDFDDWYDRPEWERTDIMSQSGMRKDIPISHLERGAKESGPMAPKTLEELQRLPGFGARDEWERRKIMRMLGFGLSGAGRA